MSTKTSNAKLQRWMDVVSALLDRQYGATFEQLLGEVPGYADPHAEPESVRRTFERDKEELLALGVPIESVGSPADQEYRYRIKSTEFYLPYVNLMSERGLEKPKHIDRHGYRALAECPFTDDEMALLADAAARARAMGDPLLATDAELAIGKFLLDVPPAALTATPGVAISPARTPAAPKTLRLLGEALQRRKSVTISYYGIGRDALDERVVHPYGLTFTNSHWYLHAFDPAQDGMRRFRVSRIAGLAVNGKTPGTADYAIPSEFSLADVAPPVPSWQLGDAPAVTAEVRFLVDTVEVRAAREHGTASSDDPTITRFDVCREDTFLLWLLSLAGDAKLVGPPAMVAAYSALCQRTLAAHRGGADGHHGH